MNAINTAQKRQNVSFSLLFIVVGAFWLVANRGELSFVPFTCLLTIVFLWQVFALSRVRRSFVLWLLAVLYALALIPFVMVMIRFQSAPQLW